MERDDTHEYSLYYHHDEEAGRKIRKKIWMVFWILLIVTTAEVLIGAFRDSLGLPWIAVKYAFIIMTLVKAFYIVMSFMHLGDEKSNLRNFIIIPYVIFIVYLVFIALVESVHINQFLNLFHGLG